MNKDRVVKTIVLKAPPERVWQALTDLSAFGVWFGAKIDGPFIAGKDVTGRIMPIQVDADVAKHQKLFRGVPWRAKVERIEPMKLFSFSWHPYAVDPAADFSQEPMTLVTFELQDAEDGILLTITDPDLNDCPRHGVLKRWS